MFSFPLSFIFMFHMCPFHFSFFKHPLFSIDTEEEEEERWRRGSRRTPGQTPKDLKGKGDPAVLAKHKEAGETGPTRATASRGQQTTPSG